MKAFIYGSIANGVILLLHIVTRERLGFFDLDAEQNAAALWMGVQLCFAGTCAFLSASILLKTIKERLPIWTLILAGLSFVYIGLDDMTMFHERLGFVLNNVFGIGGFSGESFNWLFYYMPLIIFALILYCKVFVFLRRAHRTGSTFFLVGVLLWIAALMVEYGGGRLILQPTVNEQLYHSLIVFEEAFELFGATCIVAALWTYLRTLLTRHIRITDNNVPI